MSGARAAGHGRAMTRPRAVCAEAGGVASIPGLMGRAGGGGHCVGCWPPLGHAPVLLQGGLHVRHEVAPPYPGGTGRCMGGVQGGGVRGGRG